MRILTFTSLYPNAQQKRHGIFVENRMVHFAQSFPQHQVTVVAPVPWFPFKSKLFGKYADFARVQKLEQRRGLTIYHPRYLLIPKIGMNLAPLLMALSMYFFMRKLQRQGRDFDIIDAHFFYPDGVVAAWLGRVLHKPVTCTARGNDIYLYPQYPLPKRMVQWALRTVTQPIAVCRALAQAAQTLEPEAQVLPLRNGVDLITFQPDSDRQMLRNQLGLDDTFVLICVGHFIERKGQYLVIDALQQLPDTHLLLVGDGPQQRQLQQQVTALGLQQRVSFLGAKEQKALPSLYSVADCMVLASSKEGWANVLLESMACGTPVVATAIWGTPEVVASDDAGVLIDKRSAPAIAEGVNRLRANYPARQSVRAYAEGFSWDATSAALNKVFVTLPDGRMTH